MAHGPHLSCPCSSWSEEGLGKLLDAGLNIARFNFSHGTHEMHQEVLDRLRKVGGCPGGCLTAVASDAHLALVGGGGATASAAWTCAAIHAHPACALQVATTKRRRIAYLLDTKGPEVRTASAQLPSS